MVSSSFVIWISSFSNKLLSQFTNHFPKGFSAMLKVAKLIGAGAGGREHDGISGARLPQTPIERLH
jgi:hypothetical protein